VLDESLRVLSREEVDGRHVVRRDTPTSTGPLFVSWGTFNLLCGGCDFLLMSRLPQGREAVSGVAIECPNCGALNGA